MMEMTAEDRLEKLKADIALRKLQRLQNQEKAQATPVTTPTTPKKTPTATTPKKTPTPTTPKKTPTATAQKKTPTPSTPKKTPTPTAPKKTPTPTTPKKTPTATTPKKTPTATARKKTPTPTTPKKTPITPVDTDPSDTDSDVKTTEKRSKKLKKKKQKHSLKETEADDDDDNDDGDDDRSKPEKGSDDDEDDSDEKKEKKRKKKKQKKVLKKEELEVEVDANEKASEDSGNDSGDTEEAAMETEADPNVIGGFSVLGNFTNEPIKAVKRKLPEWLANPTIIGGSLKRRKVAPGIGTGTEEQQQQQQQKQQQQQQQQEEMEKEDRAVMRILDEELKNNLRDNGITSFFPVQRQFIRELWKDVRFGITSGRAGLRPRDICVSAPTGSGKTLAYTLPLIQCLRNRTEPHIWAIVVLPVRDLAEQVYNVFCQYCAGTDLKVGLVVGKASFPAEQELLVKNVFMGYHSLVDIIVATPGRLVDHIKSTPGFDLSHLRFLVIDEADRMMEDIKHEWLSVVETAAYSTAPLAYRPLPRSPPGLLTITSAKCSQLPLQKLLFSATLSHNPEKLERLNLFMPRLMTAVVAQTHPARPHTPHPPHTPTHHPRSPHSPTHTPGQKENQSLESGEMEHSEGYEETTGDPEGQFMGKYTTPEGLTEYVVECDASEKPLMILHFLHTMKFTSVLCFTNSLETTHRLCLLAKLYGGLNVKEFSSRLPAEKRKRVLRQFSKGSIDLLVCSDVMARGMDVDNVKCVISYDRPPFIRTYIHRVGRTARAGRAGTAISLLEKKEFFHFKKMMKEAGKWPAINEMKVSRAALKPLVEPFQAALRQMPQVIKKESKKTKH